MTSEKVKKENSIWAKRIAQSIVAALFILFLIFYLMSDTFRFDFGNGLLFLTIMLLAIFIKRIEMMVQRIMNHYETFYQFLYDVILYPVVFMILFLLIFTASIKVSGFFREYSYAWYDFREVVWRTLAFLGLSFILVFAYFLLFVRGKRKKFSRFRILKIVSNVFVLALAFVFILFSVEILANFYISTREYSWNGYYIHFHPAPIYFPDGIDFNLFAKNQAEAVETIIFDEVVGKNNVESFKSEYINIVDHNRLTTDQPEEFDHTIYIFGGSTVFCKGNPDSYTLPSYLQRQVLSFEGKTYRVVNKGVPGMLTDGQYLKLRETPLEPGDVVIFFDGINDSGLPFVTIFFGNRDDIYASPIVRFMSTLSRRSAFYNYFLAPYNFLPPISRDKEVLTQAVDRVPVFAKNNIQAAQVYTEQAGATFIHFLQPYLFSLSEYSDFEKTILHNYYILPRGFTETQMLTYERMYALEEEYADLGIISFDISHVFNPDFRKTGYELYSYDAVHVGPEGNWILAEQIYQRIEPYLEK